MVKNGSANISIQAKTFELSPAFVTFTDVQETVSGEAFTPHVIEPSFGIGRIVYCLLEHAFWQRPADKNRVVLSLPPAVAPVKVALLPLLSTGIFDEATKNISKWLKDAGIAFKVGDSGSAIGRKYARMDELGVPFAITIDRATLQDQTVTLRDRDSCSQVRLHITELVSCLRGLVTEKIHFSEVLASH
jgi:glycyl-tRNA synthetase